MKESQQYAKTNIKNKKKERKKDMKGNSKVLKGWKQFLQEEEGMGTVEVILIIVVLVGLVIIFKDQITKIVNNLFSKISTQTGKV